MYYAKFRWIEKEGSDLHEAIYSNGISYGAKNSARLQAVPDPEAAPFAGAGVRPNFYNITLDLPIIEEFSFEVQSTFQKLSEAQEAIPLLGTANSIFDTVDKLGAAFSGKISAASEFRKIQVWSETEPAVFSLRAKLDTVTDPFFDVYLPQFALISQSILTFNNDGTITTPGINRKLINLVATETEKAFPKGTKDDNSLTPTQRQNRVKNVSNEYTRQLNTFLRTANSNKVLQSFEITTKNILNEEVTIVKFEPAFIEKVTPTISPEQTESGFPLWIELNVEVKSAYSANEQIFNYSGISKAYRSYQRNKRARVGSRAINSFLR